MPTKDPYEARTNLIYEMNHGQQTVQYPTTWKRNKAIYPKHTNKKHTCSRAIHMYIINQTNQEGPRHRRTQEHGQGNNIHVHYNINHQHNTQSYCIV